MDVSFLYGAAGGGAVGIIAAIVGAVGIGYIKRMIAERDELLKQQRQGLERRLEETVDKLEAHIQDDRSQEILNELKNIGGAIVKLSSQVTALLVTDAAQREQITTLFRRQEELRADLRDCKKEHKNG